MGINSAINTYSNQKCVMFRAIRKQWDLTFKRFYGQLKELNNYLLFLPILSDTNNMAPEYLNKILLHTVPNVLEKKSYLKGWYFEGKS